MNTIATTRLLHRAAIGHDHCIKPVDGPPASSEDRAMFRQAIQDALFAFQVTGSIPTALLTAMAPLVLRQLRH